MENVYLRVKASRKTNDVVIPPDADLYVNVSKQHYYHNTSSAPLRFSDLLSDVLLDHPSDFTASQDVEIADTENLCPTCLPVPGDDIIGTRHDDFITIVHRQGCVHLHYTPNRSGSHTPTPRNNYGSIHRNDLFDSTPSTTIGKTHELTLHSQHAFWNNGYANGKKTNSKKIQSNKQRFFSENTNNISQNNRIPIKLEWPVDEDSINQLYMTEIVIVAADRKLLLADCSQVVSDNADIVKTGSYTTEEHATLEFLVRVRDLKHLQLLMDKLRGINSVMSVERRVSFH